MTFDPIPNVTFVGIGSKARSGKSLAARTICERWPTRFRDYGFGDAAKVICRDLGMTKKDPAMLQRVAHGRRASDPFYWVRHLYWRIDEDRPRFAVIHDVRYRSEADFIKQMGGVLIRVDRKQPDGSVVTSTDRDPQHVSEIELDDYAFDHRVANIEGQALNFKDNVLDLVLNEILQ